MKNLNEYLNEKAFSEEDKKVILEIYTLSRSQFQTIEEILEQEDWVVREEDFDRDDVIDDLDDYTTISDAIEELVEEKREEKMYELRELLKSKGLSYFLDRLDLWQSKFRPFLQIWLEYFKSKNLLLSEETLEKIVSGDMEEDFYNDDSLEEDFLYFLSQNLPVEEKD